MSADKIGPFPLWRGKVKKKVAKRHLWWLKTPRSGMLREGHFDHEQGVYGWIASLKEGDLFHDCDGFNHRVHAVEAQYDTTQRAYRSKYHHGRGVRGQILVDLEVTYLNHLGQVCHACHPNPPDTREDIVRYFDAWKGSDGCCGFYDEYLAGTLHDDGTFTPGKTP